MFGSARSHWDTALFFTPLALFILPSYPKKHIYAKISNPVRKTLYFFALHAEHPPYKKHGDTLAGVVDIVGGLEYHIKKIRNYERAACRRLLELEPSIDPGGRLKIARPDLRRTNHWPASHEAGAYIGRLGQLACFFKSTWFKTVVDEAGIASNMPSILALMPPKQRDGFLEKNHPSPIVVWDQERGSSRYKL